MGVTHFKSATIPWKLSDTDLTHRIDLADCNRCINVHVETAGLSGGSYLQLLTVALNVSHGTKVTTVAVMTIII